MAASDRDTRSHFVFNLGAEMTHKYSDVRQASPFALSPPPRPTPFLSRADVDDLIDWLCEPQTSVCVPVYPDGEIVTDFHVGVVRLLKSLHVPLIETRLVWISGQPDIDFYRTLGIDVFQNAHPELKADLLAIGDRHLAKPIKGPSTTQWWIDRDEPKEAAGPNPRWDGVIANDLG